ncbi:mycofactocin-coupled SDR family oxidoreductase [Mycolicibacterium goodii]|uniref:mycofactocin-coupled SDR family oxidoreductase n=1 Tax=Mycolicibacterium goodii TaxID=134601 RepID=UPI001BDD1622|nr:mycofactocin-coupled SDR family oxidoreductase [Mycolicibacterium goodii]MBU8813997.1 mycofactocin-coupled SDR family oxidoreductase [Mycolicibacterium goodii]ULN49510.1 mycofactocin-coupled SDR family oxidoreductase [Mycolicibacterium goodii]
MKEEKVVKRFEGKVALITGAARGQGRSHALRFAEEGAHIVAIDICSQIDTVNYAMSRPADLDETVRLIENIGGRIVAEKVDVRDGAALRSAVDRGVAQLGRLDYVMANAGILPGIGEDDPKVAAFDDAVDVMLKGVYHTVEASIPALTHHGAGGAVVITSSAIADRSVLSPSFRTMNHGVAGYTAAKSGLIGLMHYYAKTLAEKNIRVNAVLPTGVATPMVTDGAVERYWNAFPEVGAAVGNALPGVDMIESSDVTEAMVYLCSESGRYVTGISLPVDAGFLVQ